MANVSGGERFGGPMIPMRTPFLVSTLLAVAALREALRRLSASDDF